LKQIHLISTKVTVHAGKDYRNVNCFSGIYDLWNIVWRILVIFGIELWS